MFLLKKRKNNTMIPIESKVFKLLFYLLMERKLSKHTWPCVKKLLNQANITPYLIDSCATPGSKWVFFFVFFYISVE